MSKTYYLLGEYYTINELSNMSGLPYSLLYNRIEILKWTPYDAINTDVNIKSNWNSSVLFKVHGFSGTLPTISKHFNIEYQTLLRYSNKIIKTDKNIEKIVDMLLNKKISVTNKIEEINKINELKIDKSDPIYIECNKKHKDYFKVLHRIKKEGFSLEEALIIPLEIVNTRNINYKANVGTLQSICKKYNKNFIKVYNMLKDLYDLNYIMSLDETNL